LVWKEFTSGKLTGQGFQIPISTHLRKMENFSHKVEDFVG